MVDHYAHDGHLHGHGRWAICDGGLEVGYVKYDNRDRGAV